MGCTLVLDPIVAREFCERGLDTKGSPSGSTRTPASRSAASGTIASSLIHEEVEAIEPWATYWNAPDELIPVFEPDRVNIVVAGGETNGHFSVFMGSPMRAKFRTNRARRWPSRSTTGADAAWVSYADETGLTIMNCQTSGLPFAEVGESGARTSQCSTIFPSASSRKMSTTLAPMGQIALRP